MKTAWSAIVLAGQRPGVDGLARAFGETWKARVEVGGVAMGRRVFETLRDCPEIEAICFVAQSESALFDGFDASEAGFRAVQGGISANVAAIAGGNDANWPVLVTTADHPLLTPAMVAQFLEQVGDADLAVGMVERRTMLAAYPETKRTWLKFRGGAWSGANLFALRTPAVRPALELWARAERDRKQAWRLFLRFGPCLALRALTRTISGPDAIVAAGRRLGLKARLVAMPQAEAAIDVDKPADHQLAEAILARRAGEIADA